MKNKLKIVLCVVMIAVFSFGTCSVAYSKTSTDISLSVATQIVKDYYDFQTDGYKVVPAFIYRYNGHLYMLWIDGRGVSDDGLHFTNSYGSNGLNSGAGSGDYVCLKFDDDNIYSKPTIVAKDKDCVYGIGQGNGLTEANLLTNTVDSYYDISGLNGDKLFTQGTNPSPTPTNPSLNPIPASNTLSTSLSKVFQTSGKILQEIVALLPILLPVLVTFLAIRKGIRFSLKILRTA